MKVLHICTKDHGGAGTAALRLHRGMRSNGLDSAMLVLHRASSDKSVLDLGLVDPGGLNRARRKILYKSAFSAFRSYDRLHPHESGLFSFDRTRFTVSMHPLVKEADLIILHWTANMVDSNEFFPALGGKPVIWALHDMNPMTGGCHYTGGCEKYLSGCGACPKLGSHDPNDLSRKIFRRKTAVYANHRLCLVSPSKWLADRAGESLLFKGRETHLIPHGVPCDIFTPRDRKELRDFLGLPQDKTLILFGSDHPSPRKGMDLLASALRSLGERTALSGTELVTFGHHEDPGSFPGGLPCPVHSMGYIYDDRLLSTVYSSCDMFVSPVREEAFGLTLLESMASGTPVIGYNVGGISDMMIPHDTGLLAKPGDIRDLSDKMEFLITRPADCKAMGENARELVEKEFTIGEQVKRYAALIDKTTRLC